MTEQRKNCPMRHENGNCTAAGGFCTAVNDTICEGLHNAYDCGRRAIIQEHFGEATKKVQMTNGDRMRSLPDEELASAIMCPHQFDEGFSCENDNCYKCSLEYLGQPVKEGEEQ